MPTNKTSDPATLTVEEAAQRLGISRTLAYELARRDELPVRVIRLGRRVVVPRLALETVLAGRIAHTNNSESRLDDFGTYDRTNPVARADVGVIEKPP